MRFFVSNPLTLYHWSGKLLCTLGLHLAQKQSKVLCLVHFPQTIPVKNMIDHLSAATLRQLADCLKLPLFTPTITAETLQNDVQSFLTLVTQKYGVQSVFLNNFKNDSNEFARLEKLYKDSEFQVQNLFFENNPEILFEDAINLGFKAYIFSVNEKFFSRNYLGSLVTMEMLQNFKKNNIHPFGSNGEFDAICVDGPNFENKISLNFGDIHFKNGNWYREFVTNTLS